MAERDRFVPFRSSCFQRAVIRMLEADPRLAADVNLPAGRVWAAVQAAGDAPTAIALALAQGGATTERGEIMITGSNKYFLSRSATPLHLAAALGRVSAGLALLDAGADVTALDDVRVVLLWLLLCDC